MKLAEPEKVASRSLNIMRTVARLTKREREVFDLLAAGHSEREAYLRLGIQESEVGHVWHSIAEKMKGIRAKSAEDYETLLAYERIERRRLEAEVWAGEARLNALMDTAPEAVLVVNGRSGRILKVNNNAVVMFGYSPRELMGMIMEKLVPMNKRTIHEQYRNGFLNSIRKREIGYHPPIYAVHKDGSQIRLDIALTATQSTDDVMVVMRYAMPETPEDERKSKTAKAAEFLSRKPMSHPLDS